MSLVGHCPFCLLYRVLEFEFIKGAQHESIFGFFHIHGIVNLERQIETVVLVEFVGQPSRISHIIDGVALRIVD